VNGICGCGLPAPCCQPAVAGGVIYADLRGEFSTSLALQALFTQSSPMLEPLLQAFPFPSTLGEVILHPLSQACVFVYSSHGKWVFPSLLWSFPPTTTFTSFPACDYWVVLLLLPAAMFVFSSRGKWVFPPLLWSFPPSPLTQAFLLLVVGRVPPFLRSLSGLSVLFIYSSGKDFLPPIFGVQCAPPSFPCVFVVLIAYFSVSFFSPGGGQSVQGAMLIWPRLVCGSTAVLAKLTLSASSQAVWAWVTGSPGALLISPFNVKWRCSAPVGGVEGVKVLPLLGGFTCKVCLQCLSMILL
jgi:hypothetical protein